MKNRYNNDAPICARCLDDERFAVFHDDDHTANIWYCADCYVILTRKKGTAGLVAMPLWQVEPFLRVGS